jgi:hypothetical protein
MKLNITENGNNARLALAHGTPYLNVRSDFVVYGHRNKHQAQTRIWWFQHVTCHWLRIITRLSGYVIENFIQNPSQIFYNVSGESGYDSNSNSKPSNDVTLHNAIYI